VGSSVVFSLLADFGTRCSNITTSRSTLEADVLQYLVQQYAWDTGSYKGSVAAGNCTDVQVGDSAEERGNNGCLQPPGQVLCSMQHPSTCMIGVGVQCGCAVCWCSSAHVYHHPCPSLGS
jgi:hypothetical protein